MASSFRPKGWGFLLVGLALILLGCVAQAVVSGQWSVVSGQGYAEAAAHWPLTTEHRPLSAPGTPCGSLSFAPPVTYYVGIRPRSAAGGDFNRDTHPDVVVTDYSSRTVSVLLGNPDGTFQPSVSYLVGVHPVTPAVGDLNGDQVSDLVVANYDSANVSVLLGNPDGTFQPASNYSSNIGPYGATVGDFNEDGHLDVATSNVNFGTINVMLGNGDGSLQGPTQYQAGLRPQVIATADFNGDGHLDLVTPNYSSTTVSVLMGNGDGTFQPAVTFPVESGPDFLVVADLNGDTHPDLAVPHYSTNNISVLLGNGDGTFRPEVLYPAGGPNPLFVAVGDFNGDDAPDLAAANYGGNTIGILLGNGDGTFRPAVTFAVGAGTSPVAVVPGNFNGDTHLDMFVANENTDNGSVFINTCAAGTVTPTPTAQATPSPTPTCPPAWGVVPSPNVGTGHNLLKGVAAVSANDVWAVGEHVDGAGITQTLVERWDGSAWSIVPSLKFDAVDSHLEGVAALSANDAWAVGYFNGGSLTLVAHWDGVQWSIVPSPNPGSSGNWLKGVAAVSANDVWAVGYYQNAGGHYATLVEHWNGSAWSVVSSPSPGPGIADSLLYGVAAVAANDVWAVGRLRASDPPFPTLIEHWDGSSWSVVPGANGGLFENYLNAVAVVSANDVWAVGYYRNSGNGPSQTLVERWNGSSWSRVPSPNAGTDSNYLNGVAAVAANDVWAVGSSSGNQETLVERWDGSAWSIVPSPSPGSMVSELLGVAAVGAGDVWAVGGYTETGTLQTLVERYHYLCGTPTATSTPATPSPINTRTATRTNTPTPTPICAWAWSVVSSPNIRTGDNLLTGVAALWANDIWAVGYYNNILDGYYQTLVEHWDGTQWSVVSSPNVRSTSNFLHGVAALSANNIWAVGHYGSQTLVEHWDGSVWSVIPSPSPGTYNYLYGVAAISANDVWAVGYANYSGNERTLIEHWDGTQWSEVPGPNPGTRGDYLYGVTAVSASDVWAAGSFRNNDPPYLTLVEHWNGSTWSVVPSPSPGSGTNELYGVAAVSANDVWVVGTYNDTGVAPYRTLVEHWNGTQWSLVPSPNLGSGNNSLTGVAAVRANDVWAVGTFSNPSDRTLVEHWDGSTWSAVPGPNASPNNGLSGVAAVATNDVWAVGDYYDPSFTFHTLVERYHGPCVSPTATSTPATPSPTNTRTATPTIMPTPPMCGPAWGVVSSPNHPGSLNQYWSGVAAVSANDIWAVGRWDDSVEVRVKTLVGHWNGSVWSLVSSPNPGSSMNELYGVAAVSANDVWAVGYYLDTDLLGYHTLVEHWNGSTWSQVPSPNPARSNWLNGVAAVSANDMWAVGRTSVGTLIEHWDGSSWSVVPNPSPGLSDTRLNGVAAVSANDVWAVGYYDYYEGVYFRSHILVQHWDGSEWSVVSSPRVGAFDYLFGITAVSANDVWAVGRSGLATLVVHWDGTQWSQVFSPGPATWGNSLNAVTAVSANDIWAVGSHYYQGGARLLFEHWDGSSWSWVPNPNPGTNDSFLNGVVAVSANDVWAVGGFDAQTLVERYHEAFSFSDVHPDDYFYEPVRYLYCHGVISGYADYTFRPYNLTTRGQLAKIVVLAEGWTIYTPPTPTFRDVPASDPFYTFVETAYQRGIISGYDCGMGCLEYRPGNNITRAQLCKIVVLAERWSIYTPPAPTFRDVPADDPFYGFVETAYQHGIISGYGCGAGCLEFRPGNNATRGQICKIVYLAVTGP